MAMMQQTHIRGMHDLDFLAGRARVELKCGLDGLEPNELLAVGRDGTGWQRGVQRAKGVSPRQLFDSGTRERRAARLGICARVGRSKRRTSKLDIAACRHHLRSTKRCDDVGIRFGRLGRLPQLWIRELL